jgi:hypothetical protein
MAVVFLPHKTLDGGGLFHFNGSVGLDSLVILTVEQYDTIIIQHRTRTTCIYQTINELNVLLYRIVMKHRTSI